MAGAAIQWLRDEAVLAMHHQQLAEHGGSAGVRDPGLLASALARPKNLLAYGDPPPDLAALAAAYAFGIARNHPFIDGNKRTAFVACYSFLALNGHQIVATPQDAYTTFLALAAGDLSDDELADWIRERMKTTS